MRWQVGVEASAIKAGITDWQTKARDREQFWTLLRQAKTISLLKRRIRRRRSDTSNTSYNAESKALFKFRALTANVVSAYRTTFPFRKLLLGMSTTLVCLRDLLIGHFFNRVKIQLFDLCNLIESLIYS